MYYPSRDILATDEIFLLNSFDDRKSRHSPMEKEEDLWRRAYILNQSPVQGALKNLLLSSDKNANRGKG